MPVPETLDAYLRAVLPGLQGRMRIEAIGAGQPDFRVRFDNRILLLRMQPGRGKLLALPSASGRECRILQALAATDVPVPRIVLHCDDPQAAGAPFLLMEIPAGRVFADYALPELAVAERRAIFFAMAETMARLHRVDWAAAGLAGYGRPAGFYRRALEHAQRRCARSEAGGDRDMARLAAWLSSHVPDDDEAVVCHGDFRLGQLVFDPIEARVVAVLGWEHSTLGHPLAEVAHNCLPWQLGPRMPGGIRGLDLARQGIPTQAEYLTHYRQCGGYAESINVFHLAFSLFHSALEKLEAGGTAQTLLLVQRAIELVDGCAACEG